jgi:hypothetical protein
MWGLLLFLGVSSGEVLIYRGIRMTDVTFYVENRCCVLVKNIYIMGWD